MTKQETLLTRLANLERENVEMQEEILGLKQELRQQRLSTSKPSSELQELIAELRSQVLLAVAELKKYRKREQGDHETVPGKGKAHPTVKPSAVIVTTLERPTPLVKQQAVERTGHAVVNTADDTLRAKKIDDFDFDEFFNDPPLPAPATVAAADELDELLT